MAWQFGDGFDLYAAPADTLNGYWDSGTTSLFTLQPGRFAGSRCIQESGGGVWLVKSSSVNDAVHHLAVSFLQATAITGTNPLNYFQLLDGTTGQCCIVFRSDGTILLTSGTTGGTVLATYSSAFPVINTWYAFEFEVSINNTTGVFNVRRNGNTSNDFSATGLNTRTTTNNYANKLQVGCASGGAFNQQFDDLFWRSDASSVPWMGDIRCYTRMPASDQSVQFARTPNPYVQTPQVASNTSNTTAGGGWYMPFTAAYTGTVSAATISMAIGYTGNMKCAIYSSTGTLPNLPIATATPISNPVVGSNTFTFPTPPSIVQGTQYWLGFCSDTTTPANSVNTRGTVTTALFASGTYAAFPPNTPTGTPNSIFVICSWSITTTVNAQMVAEAQQDATTSYVYDSTVNDADFYGIAAIASTPVATIAVTTRGYMQKSDAGTRTAAVQLKSGASTVASPTLTLTTSGWLWAWRTDVTDPNTSAAWTPVAVNNCNIGPKVIA